MKRSYLKTFSFLLFFLSLALTYQIQAQTSKKTIKGILLDADNSNALPFAHIYLKNRPRVISTSNQEGFFSIQAEDGDTLMISFIGYQGITKRIHQADTFLQLKLKALSVAISTIEIEEESDFLYQLLSRSRKTNAYYSKLAKVYYFQESAINGQNNEMMEAYYNARFMGYDLKGLQLKNGRIGLQAYKDQYFINMQSSNAVMMHQLINPNRYFPNDPIGMGKRKLKKSYELSYKNKYHDEENRLIYEIKFTARRDAENHFNGVVWIDSTTANLHKIELKVENTKAHPFLPLFSNHSIERLDLFVRKTFEQIDEKSYPREIDFGYRIQYANSREDTLMVESRSLLYAFDYKEGFNLPLFHFPEELNNDHRKINAIPYNSQFWNNKPFKIDDNNGRIEAFFQSKSTLRAKNAYVKSGQKKSFFEHPYVVWKGDRIRMREMMREEMLKLPKSKEDCLQMENEIEINLYNFEVQLFMDINYLNDSLYYTNAAIFDPYNSYYYLEQDKISTVFINIYFDLAEIQNRKLILALQGIHKKEKAIEIYHKVNSEFDAISKKYFSEVRRGQDIEELKSWNDYVRSQLGIDNFEIFQLSEQEEN